MTDSPSQSKLGTIVSGFFILLPFILAYLMIGQLFDMLMALTQPVFDLLPGVFIKDDFTGAGFGGPKINVETSGIPEPTSIALAALGLLALLGFTRRRRITTSASPSA